MYVYVYYIYFNIPFLYIYQPRFLMFGTLIFGYKANKIVLRTPNFAHVNFSIYPNICYNFRTFRSVLWILAYLANSKFW